MSREASGGAGGPGSSSIVIRIWAAGAGIAGVSPTFADAVMPGDAVGTLPVDPAGSG